jgi:hypothetical protein
MNMFGPLSRAIVLGAAMVATTSLPAFAGPAEMAVLSKYLGTWKGVGTMTGGQSQSVTCRMALTKGNGDKLNYNGRCSIAGAQIAVYGTIAYIDAKHRYEAAMTSGIGGFNGVAIGQRSGDKIVFNLQQRANDNQGTDITIASKVVLSGASMGVEFHATFNSTGEKIDASIPFSKVS